MAEKIVSPGVFTKENDLSFVQAGVGAIGAAIIGPTVKGPALVPTKVWSYSEYLAMFGDVRKEGTEYHQYLTSYTAKEYLKHGGPLTVCRVPTTSSGYWGHASASWTELEIGEQYTDATFSVGIPTSGSTTASGDFTASFKLNTISHGTTLNSEPSSSHTTQSNNLLQAGTMQNIRWEVSTVNEAKGTFSLLIRRGNDTDKRKVIAETWNNLSLDPTSNNYISKRIGDQYYTIGDPTTADPYLQLSGSYPNKSAYVYVDEVGAQTVDYLDDNGQLTTPAYTESLPRVSNGYFAGGAMDEVTPVSWSSNIESTNTQGMNCNTSKAGYENYVTCINLLKNADEYDINLIMAPGICNNEGGHTGINNKLVTMCEERGDCMAIIDPVVKDSTITDATTQAESFDSSYAAMYWPWVQIADNVTGKYVWVPQATIMPGIYAFNDKVSAEWFAPAGLNRGGQELVIQAERKLTHANRDDMYEKNLNPVATFPGEGVVVWGQKTLQKKASALDRVNVRRLLINLKKFIASTSKYLVFENNTAATRNRFLSTVNPYMESVQQRQGLYAFKVVMDETNNTPDVIDRNIMKGDIFLQPAKAAEFIVIDFNVMPTGATFND